jgi:hypothetical protein
MPTSDITMPRASASVPRSARRLVRAAFAGSALLALALGVPALAQPAGAQPGAGAGGMRMAQPEGEPLLVTLLRALPEGTPGVIQIWSGDPTDGAELMNALEFVVGEGDAIPRISLPNGTTIRFRPFDGHPEAGGAAQFTFELLLGSGEEERFLEVVRALAPSAAYVEVDVLAAAGGPGGAIRGPASDR